ncbi:MAG: protein kinase [Pirellulaceae bacterium]|nr:protein kinase [Pirellulaceae bacterium]
MATVSADRLIELVTKSQLAEPARLEAALERIRSAHDGQLPTDVIELAKALQREKVITRWHAEKLIVGKYKGFFLGKYKLLGHIGSGGMSSVYLAEHTKMNDLRAIKVLPPSKMGKSSYLARFQQEAKAIASLNHPNIVRAFDIDNDGDIHFIVMEYVDGIDLQNLVKKKGPLPFDQVADYVAQAAHGLQHAHEVGLIHRDVKPANLLLRKDGRIKLLDLGLALFADESQASLTIDHSDKVLGTADYLAPEQALNSHGVDHRADLYALGCTMYYLLTGSPPFPSGSIAQRIAKHQREMPKEIRKLRPECPGELEGICWKLLQKDPMFRYTTAQQTAEVLEAWLASYRASSVPNSARTATVAGDSASRNTSGLSQLGARISDLGSRTGDSSTSRSGLGSSSSGLGSSLSDTMNNRGAETLPGRSGSGITNLSASDSGVLVRLASASSSGSSSRIDLQAEMKPRGPKPGGAGSASPGRSPASQPVQKSRTAAPARSTAHAPSRPASTTANSAPAGPLPVEPTRKALWIAGLLVMFLLAVLLGVVIERLVANRQPSPVNPTEQSR